MKHLQQVQLDQAEKLKQIAAQLQAQISAFEQMKAAAGHQLISAGPPIWNPGAGRICRSALSFVDRLRCEGQLPQSALTDHPSSSGRSGAFPPLRQTKTPSPLPGRGELKDFDRLRRVHHAEEHLRVVPRRGHITDGPPVPGMLVLMFCQLPVRAEMP